MKRDFKYLKAGNPTKYEGEATIDKSIEYLESCIDDDPWEEFVDGPRGGSLVRRHSGKVKFPNAGGLARHLGVHRDTLYEWSKIYPEFKSVLKAMNAEQLDRVLNGGLDGTYNSTISALIAAKHGYKREISNTIKNPDGSLNPMNKLSKNQLEALAEAEIKKSDNATDNTTD